MIDPDRRRCIEVETVSAEAVATSRIEGETVDAGAVRSSVARRLHVPEAAAAQPGAAEEAIAAVTVIALGAAHLDAARVRALHRLLFPETGGVWRRGPMRVVSGAIGQERVHFEAPPAERVPAEIDTFFAWLASSEAIEPLVRAAIAHLWFVTIHPFIDGNGRISRAIADHLLAREPTGRIVLMTAQILIERSAYYEVLERTQRGDLDITEWIVWFLGAYKRAATQVLTVIDDARTAERFWQRANERGLNERQRRVLARMIEPDWIGKMTTRTYALLAKTSDDTAARDLVDLAAKSIVRRSGAGKATAYELVLP